MLDLSESMLLGVSRELESAVGLMSSLCCDSELTELVSPSPSPPLDMMLFSSAFWNHRHTKFKVKYYILGSQSVIIDDSGEWFLICQRNIVLSSSRVKLNPSR